MSTRTALYKAGDYLVRLTVTRKSTGLAIDLSDYNDIIVILYNKESNKIISKYRLVETEGYGEVIIEDAVAGIINVQFESPETTNAETGNVDAEIMVQAENEDYPSDEFHTIGRGFIVGFMYDSIVKKLI